VTRAPFSRLTLSLLVAVSLAGCTDWPKESEAERDFLTDYPGLKVTRCYPGEANSDAIYYHIEYSDPKTGKTGTTRVIYTREPGKKTWSHSGADPTDLYLSEKYPIVLPGPSKTNN